MYHLTIGQVLISVQRCASRSITPTWVDYRQIFFSLEPKKKQMSDNNSQQQGAQQANAQQAQPQQKQRDEYPHLSNQNSAINIRAVMERAKDDLTKCLNRMPGKKVLVLDDEIIGPLGHIADSKFLRVR